MEVFSEDDSMAEESSIQSDVNNNGNLQNNVCALIEAPWVNKQTNKTPKRNVVKQYRNMNITSDIYQRQSKCTGHIVYRVSVDENGNVKGCKGSCVNCSDHTSYYCTECRHWLCGPSKVSKKTNVTITSAEEEDGTSKSRPNNGIRHYVQEHDGKHVYFRNSCWIIWHENGLMMNGVEREEKIQLYQQQQQTTEQQQLNQINNIHNLDHFKNMQQY